MKRMHETMFLRVITLNIPTAAQSVSSADLLVHCVQRTALFRAV